jgi:biopolymer transport protein ExbD
LCFKIDPKIRQPVADTSSKLKEKAPTIRVEVTAGGEYFIDGEEQSQEEVEAALKKEREEDGATVLQIVADKEVELKFVQRLIKLGSAAGIDWLSYGVLNKEKK